MRLFSIVGSKTVWKRGQPNVPRRGQRRYQELEDPGVEEEQWGFSLFWVYTKW